MKPDYFNQGWHKILVRSGLRSAANIIRFGKDAPLAKTVLNVDPNTLFDRYFPTANKGIVLGSRFSGTIIDGDWDLAVRRFDVSAKYRACHAHFVGGKSWAETGIIERLEKLIRERGHFDQCYSTSDLIARYERLDRLWEIINQTKTLPKTSQTPLKFIMAHVTRDAKLLFGNQGYHRLAMAQLAGLPTIPVVLGITHRDAVLSGKFVRDIKCLTTTS